MLIYQGTQQDLLLLLTLLPRKKTIYFYNAVEYTSLNIAKYMEQLRNTKLFIFKITGMVIHAPSTVEECKS